MSCYADAQEVVGPDAATFMSALRTVMDQNGITQSALARSAEVDPAMLCRWLGGVKEASEWTRLKLDDALQRAIYGS